MPKSKVYYVDQDELIADLSEKFGVYSEVYMGDVIEYILDYHSWDVEDVVYGKWQASKCSVCGAEYADVEGYHRCPNCGAHMED